MINRYNSLLSKVVPYDYRSHVTETLRVRPTLPEHSGFLIGAATERNPTRGAFFSQCYNGKIDRCGVQGAALDRAALDAIRDGGTPDAAACSPTGTRGRLHRARHRRPRWRIPAHSSCTPRASTARCEDRPAGTGTAATTAFVSPRTNSAASSSTPTR